LNDEKLKWLSRLSIKWRDPDEIASITAEGIDDLLRFGLVEAGTDVAILRQRETIATLRYIVTGDRWQVGLCQRAIEDSGITDMRDIVVCPVAGWFYLRLTTSGENVRRSRTWPELPVDFQAERVDYFDERETDEEKLKCDAVSKLRLYMRRNMNEAYRELRCENLAFTMTQNGIRRRLSADQHARLSSEISRVVTGQEHWDFQRDLIARFWPDLADDLELHGKIDAYQKASSRLKAWTGLGMPCSHRDWRALAEWAGLQADKITDEWLQEFLYPRLVVLWLKKPKPETLPPKSDVPALDDRSNEAVQTTEADASSKAESPDEKSGKRRKDWPADPPPDGSRHKFGPLTGTLSLFARLEGVDARTLYSRNGKSHFYIRKQLDDRYEIWFDSQRVYAKWNAEIMAESLK